MFFSLPKWKRTGKPRDPNAPPQAAADSAKDLRTTLLGLEEVLLGGAMGTAKFSLRLKRSVDRHAGVQATVQEALQTSENLASTSAEVARSARQSAEIARTMAELTAEGQNYGRESAESSEELSRHTRMTADRLEDLMNRIQEVSQVTDVIGEIANQTNLLALNAAIEAAHAREMGKGFAVVAEEVRKLAEKTASQTSEVTKLVNEVLQAFEALHREMDQSIAMAGRTTERTSQVGDRLKSLLEMADRTSGISSNIAGSIGSQSEAIATLREASRHSAEAMGHLRDDILGFADEALVISTLMEGGLHYLSRHPTGSFFNRTLDSARELSRRAEAILSTLVADGRCRLEDLFSLEYTEIRGDAVARLGRLFDVSRVPASGFAPPKYHTAYDALAEQAFMALFDEILAREPEYSYALAVDLNVYVVAHNAIYSKDWTGDPAQDAVGNRCKRLFCDNPVLLNGVRIGLGEAAAGLPQRASLEQLRRAGCQLQETEGARNQFLVQTYARDTGNASILLSVPLFVRGQRWGSALIGWEERTSRV
jgi:methyl-accepting chemotaxis protein